MIEIGENEVTLSCFNPSSFPAGVIIGHISKQEGDTLYVGVKYRILIGAFLGDDMTSEFRLPVEGQVNQIVLKGGNEERIVWNREDMGK
ncbi:MAG: hypothetical protein Q4F05_04535 [bacterium]|nr:hypothetical protein [bacterium]